MAPGYFAKKSSKITSSTIGTTGKPSTIRPVTTSLSGWGGSGTSGGW